MFTVTALTKAVTQATDIINTSYFLGMAQSFGRTQHSCLSEPRSLSVLAARVAMSATLSSWVMDSQRPDTVGPSWEGAEMDELFYERSQRSSLKWRGKTWVAEPRILFSTFNKIEFGPSIVNGLKSWESISRDWFLECAFPVRDSESVFLKWECVVGLFSEQFIKKTKKIILLKIKLGVVEMA